VAEPLTSGAINAWRMASHGLLGPRWQQPAEAVAGLGGIQAQYSRWALWSAGLRVPGATEESVQRALDAREIVRTWAFRGTLHFIAASDLPWLLPLLAPRIIASNARRYRQLGLDEAAFARTNEVIERLLQGGKQRVRSEIARGLAAEGISAQGQRAPYLLQRAALDGVICQGPQRGREPTYVLLPEWIGAQPAPKGDDGPAALARRYFDAHGPATVRDLAWWAGLTVTAARQALDGVSSLIRVAADGVEMWATTEPPATPGGPVAYLLPPFDDYVLGYKDRSWALEPAFAKRVNAGGGILKPAIVVDGAVAGIWSRTIRGGRMVVTLAPFRPLSGEARHAVESAAGRLGAFYGMEVALRDNR
jgi:hypothetical protein